MFKTGSKIKQCEVEIFKVVYLNSEFRFKIFNLGKIK